MQKFFSICIHLETAVVRISVQGQNVVIFVIHFTYADNRTQAFQRIVPLYSMKAYDKDLKKQV